MDNVSPAPTGALLQSFGYGKAFVIWLWLFGAMCIGVAGFVGYIEHTTVSTNGAGPGLSYSIIGFMLLLALCMFALALWQKKLRDARYEVYESGIRQITAKGSEFVPFREMDDLYLFASSQTIMGGLINNLAYRRNPSEPFRCANTHLHDLEGFMELVRDRYLDVRFPLAIETLCNGGAVHFNYADSKQVWRKRMMGYFLEIDTKSLRITRDLIEVDGQAFPVSLLRYAELSSWTEKVVIKDNDGKVVLSTVVTGIMSMDLFLNVMAWLQQEQQSLVDSKVSLHS